MILSVLFRYKFLNILLLTSCFFRDISFFYICIQIVQQEGINSFLPFLSILFYLKKPHVYYNIYIASGQERQEKSNQAKLCRVLIVSETGLP